MISNSARSKKIYQAKQIARGARAAYFTYGLQERYGLDHL